MLEYSLLNFRIVKGLIFITKKTKKKTEPFHGK